MDGRTVIAFFIVRLPWLNLPFGYGDAGTTTVGEK